MHSCTSPSQLLHDSKADLNAEIVRNSARNAALVAMITEQQQRIQVARMQRTLDALVAAINRQATAQAELAEQERRAALHWRHDIMDQIRSTASRKAASVLGEIERASQIDAGFPADANGDVRVSLLETIQRMGGRSSAIDAMEAERVERIHANKIDMICDELTRAVARMGAAKASEAEKTEQIAADAMHTVCDEIRRAAAANIARAATTAEQARRVAERTEDTDWSTLAAADDVVNISSYFGDAVTSAHKAAINEEVCRRGGQAAAVAQMAEEQHRRHTTRQMLVVCEDLERSVARSAAAAAADAEQQHRTAFDARHEVMAQLRSDRSRKTAATAAAEEQEWRTKSGIDRTYWTVDPATVSETKHALNRNVERLGATAAAQLSADREQVGRVREDRMHEVCDDLRRSVAQSWALNAVQTEQAQRVTIDRIHSICSDIRRGANCKIATDAAEAERAARVTSGPANTDRTDIHEQLIRRGNQTSALDAMEAERAARIQQDRMCHVSEELTRNTAQRDAARVMQETQQAAVTERVMQQVLDGLINQHRRKSAAAVTTAEQNSLVRDPVQLPAELKELHKLLTAEITAPRAC